MDENPPEDSSDGARLEAEDARHTLYPVSWLPVGIPDGPQANYYTFKVKSLLSHFVPAEIFRASAGCQKTLQALQKIKNLCENNRTRLIVVYAPDKPHVLLPLLNEQLPASQLHAFMALKAKNLPSVSDLPTTVLSRLGGMERVMADFCQQANIEFVTLTDPLRNATSAGKQVYFTYDQHWTPVGHEIVATVLANYLKTSK